MVNSAANNTENKHNRITLGSSLFDQNLGRITRSDSAYDLEPRVSELLTLLCSTSSILSRNSILDLLWGDSGSDEALTQAISKLRRALGDTTRPHKVIETVPKRGYRLLVTPELASSDVNLQTENRAPKALSTLHALSLIHI